MDATPRGVLPRRQTSKVCGSLEEARAFVTEVRTVTDGGNTYGKPAPVEVVVDRRGETVDELCTRWLASRIDVRQNTRGGYTRWLTPVRRFMGEQLVSEVNIADIQSLVNWLYSEGGRPVKPGQTGGSLSVTSVRSILKAVRQVFDLATDEGITAKNVARAPSIRLPRESNVEMDENDQDAPDLPYWPTTGEGANATIPAMAKFLAVADQDRLAGAWRLSACGFTRSELLGFRWSDVNFETGEVTVRRGRTQLDGGDDAVDEPKSKSRYRALSVDVYHSGTIALLRRLRALQTQERLAAGSAYTSTGYIVVDELGVPLKPRTYGDRFARLCRSANVPVIRLHKLRATLAQFWLAQGMPQDVCAAALGHTLQVFVNFYVPRADNQRMREYARPIVTAA